MKAETGNSSKSKIKKPLQKSSSRSQLDDNMSVRSEEYKEKPVPRTHCRDHPSLQLSFYCETCEELACEECRISGPHNTDEHWMMQIDQAYQSRVLKLGYLCTNKLAARKQEIGQEIQKLSAVRDEVRQCGETIADETKEVFSGIFGRLASAAEPKTARLAAEISQMQENLQEVNSTIQDCYNATRDHTPPLFLLSQWPNFRERINHILSKQLNKEISETPYDLPRELTEVRQSLEEMNNYEALVRFKDDIILQLLEDNFAAEREISQRNNDHLEETVGYWIQTSQKLMDELKSKNLVCFFCALPMDESSVNGNCMVNSPHNHNLVSSFEGFSDDRPDYEYFGSGPHYFGVPSGKRLSDPHVMNIMHTHASSGSSNPYKASLEADLQTSLNKMRSKLEEFRVDAQSLAGYLRGFDTGGLDTLTKVTLEFALDDAFGILPQELQPVLNVLDPFRKQLVNLAEFVRLLYVPDALESIPFFFYAENSMVHGYQQYLNKFEGYRQMLWQQEQALQKQREQEYLQQERQRLWLEKEAAKVKGGDKSGQGSTGGRHEGGRPRLKSGSGH